MDSLSNSTRESPPTAVLALGISDNLDRNKEIVDGDEAKHGCAKAKHRGHSPSVQDGVSTRETPPNSRVEPSSPSRHLMTEEGGIRATVRDNESDDTVMQYDDDDNYDRPAGVGDDNTTRAVAPIDRVDPSSMSRHPSGGEHAIVDESVAPDTS